MSAKSTKNIVKTITAIVMTAVCLCGFNSFAKDAPNAGSFKETLSGVPAAELPALAAKLVKDAKPQDREAVTIEVVKAAVGINPAAAPQIVSAIAKAVPEMAAVAAGTAAEQQPKLAGAITKAAAAAAPSKAGRIVMAVAGVVTNEYRFIAVAAAEAAPTYGKDILKAVATTNPKLKPYIDQALADYGLSIPPVGETLDQAKAAQNLPQSGNLTLESMTNGKGVSGNPAFIPPSAPEANPAPNVSGSSLQGTRNYSRP
jgi:hypothetical protein